MILSTSTILLHELHQDVRNMVSTKKLTVCLLWVLSVFFVIFLWTRCEIYLTNATSKFTLSGAQCSLTNILRQC